MIHEAASDSSIRSLSDGYVERQKIRDLTNRVNEVYRAESRSELLSEAIRESIQHLPEMQEVFYAPFAREYGTKVKGRSLVLSIGDFHYGAKIHVEGLHDEVLNHYDHNVFEDRMMTLLDETIDILKKESIS